MTTRTETAESPPHPLAGKRMTGAEIIVQVLVDEGVRTVFGYSGGAILPTYDAVFRYNDEHRDDNGAAPLPLIVPANEQGAGFMAAGYARASGRVGVCMVTSGPGATNTVTPIRDSLADSVPMVVICGQVPTNVIGTDAFQEAPVSAIMGSVAKHVFLVTDPQQLEATVRTAFEIAAMGRPGPVVIDVPKDVQNWIGEFQGTGRLPIDAYRRRIDAAIGSEIPDSAAESFFDILRAAKRPLIYAGGGVISANATEALRAFARRFGIPITTTLMGIGACDTTDPLAMRMLGMHGAAAANYAVDDCDFLIAIGARFDDRVAAVPDKFAPRALKVAHFDIDPCEIGKVKSADWHNVGLLDRDLRQLIAWADRKALRTDFSAWHRELDDLKRTYAMDYDRASTLIQPNYLIEQINLHTRGNAIITTGVGQHQMWSAQYFDFREPRLWLTSGSMGTMGYGLPAAIGAQVGAPGTIVIDVDGDGSIRMNLGEMETCTNYDIPVKILLLNNKGDGMVVQWQTLYFGSRFSGTDKTLHQKDFVASAKADGFKFAERVEAKADLEKKVAEFIAFDGPAFLEVMTDNTAFVYPMVGPGLAYKDMLTGPHIQGRTEDPFAKLDAADAF